MHRNTIRNREWRKQYPDEFRAQKRKENLARKFGLTPEEYDRMEAAQHGLCAICGHVETTPAGSDRTRRLAVDHCHKTKNVRGLLCRACNQAIGLMQDDITRLENAIRYLKLHSSAPL